MGSFKALYEAAKSNRLTESINTQDPGAKIDASFESIQQSKETMEKQLSMALDENLDKVPASIQSAAIAAGTGMEAPIEAMIHAMLIITTNREMEPDDEEAFEEAFERMSDKIDELGDLLEQGKRVLEDAESGGGEGDEGGE